MPLFLPKDLALEWVKNDLPEAEYRKILAFEMPESNMEYCSVWTFRSPKMRPDGKDKTAPWEWPGLPALGEMNPV
jgi:hypothetical protein